MDLRSFHTRMILFSHDLETVEVLPPVPHATLTHTMRVRVYVGEEDLHLHFVGGGDGGRKYGEF